MHEPSVSVPTATYFRSFRGESLTAVSGEERCVTTLTTAAKETSEFHESSRRDTLSALRSFSSLANSGVTQG